MALIPQGPDRPGFFRPQSEINVTPLVDVMLVLLIIFMVTAPLLTSGMKVTLPQASAAKPLDPNPLTVSIDREGKLTVGGDAVAEEDLAQLILAKIGNDANRVVHLRGDKDIAYGKIIAVMNVLSTHGISRIAIVTDPAPAAK